MNYEQRQLLTGGSAFPGEASDGMTLRDFFAGQLLASGIASYPVPRSSAILIAADAYRLADAMLVARRMKTERPETTPEFFREVYDGDPERVAQETAAEGEYEPRETIADWRWYDGYVFSSHGEGDKSNLPGDLFDLLTGGLKCATFRVYGRREAALADLAQAQAQINARENK
jgi:hypothetical protein